jgi:hypothetical protein
VLPLADQIAHRLMSEISMAAAGRQVVSLIVLNKNEIPTFERLLSNVTTIALAGLVR